jgi:hypothetical protein
LGVELEFRLEEGDVFPCNGVGTLARGRSAIA